MIGVYPFLHLQISSNFKPNKYSVIFGSLSEFANNAAALLV